MGSQFSFNWDLTFLNLKYYFSNMIWNVILLYIFYRLIAALSNKQYFSWVIMYAIFIVFSIANYLKILYRNEPIIPNDLTMITALGDILSYLTKKDIILTVVAIVILISLVVGSFFIKNQTVYESKIERIVRSVVVIGVLVSLFAGNNLSNNFYEIGKKFGYSNQFWDMEYHYTQNGPLIGFFSITNVIAMDDINYDEEDINYLRDYKKVRDNAEDDHIFVYILGESFIDPTRIEGVEINKDPIPFIRSIMNDYTSGLLYQSTVGGGTSKAEYEALTSFSNSFYHKSISTPYQFPVADLESHPMIGDLFDNSIAIHTNTANLYRRVDVFNTMGFDRFKYDNNKNDDLIYKDKIDNHLYISDLSGFKEVLHTISEIQPDESGFIYLATMQNHTPYSADHYTSNDFVVSNNYDPAIISEFEPYLKGLNETDQAMQYFIEEINKLDRPVTVVFFGDHYPPFAKNLVENNENFKTDYFIYQNYKKEKLNYQMISTNFLSVLALKLTEIQPSNYYQFLDAMFNEYQVLHQKSIVRNNSLEFESIENYETALQFYNQYKVLQYDIVRGNQYSIKQNFYEN